MPPAARLSTRWRRIPYSGAPLGRPASVKRGPAGIAAELLGIRRPSLSPGRCRVWRCPASGSLNPVDDPARKGLGGRSGTVPRESGSTGAAARSLLDGGVREVGAGSARCPPCAARRRRACDRRRGAGRAGGSCARTGFRRRARPDHHASPGPLAAGHRSRCATRPRWTGMPGALRPHPRRAAASSSTPGRGSPPATRRPSRHQGRGRGRVGRGLGTDRATTAADRECWSAVRDHRQVINTILWKLRTGALGRDLPERYGELPGRQDQDGTATPPAAPPPRPPAARPAGSAPDAQDIVAPATRHQRPRTVGEDRRCARRVPARHQWYRRASAGARRGCGLLGRLLVRVRSEELSWQVGGSSARPPSTIPGSHPAETTTALMQRPVCAVHPRPALLVRRCHGEPLPTLES